MRLEGVHIGRGRLCDMMSLLVCLFVCLIVFFLFILCFFVCVYVCLFDGREAAGCDRKEPTAPTGRGRLSERPPPAPTPPLSWLPHTTSSPLKHPTADSSLFLSLPVLPCFFVQTKAASSDRRPSSTGKGAPLTPALLSTADSSLHVPSKCTKLDQQYFVRSENN